MSVVVASVHLLRSTLHLFFKEWKSSAEHSLIFELLRVLPKLAQLDFVCMNICTMLIYKYCMCVCVCLYKWFIWLLSTYIMTYLCECMYKYFFQVGMNMCSFSIPDLWICCSRLNFWVEPDKRQADKNQHNWLHAEHRGQRPLWVSPTLVYTVSLGLGDIPNLISPAIFSCFSCSSMSVY